MSRTVQTHYKIAEAFTFHEWQFRLQIKKSLCKEEELPALTAKVVDALDLVLGLLTLNVHVHLSRLSSISGTDFVGLLDDAIESILDPTEIVTARHSRHSCWQFKRLSWLWMRMETRLVNGVINRWTHLLTLVKGNRVHLLSLCESSRSRPLTLCEGSRRCLVFLRSRSDSYDAETAFFAAESFVIDQEHDERVWPTLE